MRRFALGVFVGFALCVACIVAVGIWNSSHAESWLVLSGFAMHLSKDSHCHDHWTKGVGIEKGDYAIGVYDNSNCRTSFYAARTWMPFKSGSVRAGLIGGAVSGYTMPVSPVAGFAATYERKDWGVNLLYVPPLKDSGNVLWLTWKRKW